MSYYLSMDGIDDYILTPSISFTRIVLDVQFTGIDYTRNNGIIDTRKDIPIPYVFVSGTSGGKYLINGYVVKENGVTVSNDSYITLNQRMMIEVMLTGTGRINIFSDSSNARPIKGDIYDIKVYNGGALAAHYDIQQGNVQDQSGNGKHAALFGGTFVYVPPPAVHYEETVIDGVLVTDVTSKVSRLLAGVYDSLAVSDTNTAVVVSKTVVIVDVITLLDGISKDVRKVTYDDIGLIDDINAGKHVYAAVVDDLALSDALINEARAIIGTIKLTGAAETNVYLVGGRLIDVFLRGDIG